MKKITQRDIICLDHDKYKTNLIKITAKGKDPIKKQEAEKKYEEQKELFKKINTELIQEMRALYNSRLKDFITEFNLLISAHAALFKAMSESYNELIEEKKKKSIVT